MVTNNQGKSRDPQNPNVNSAPTVANSHPGKETTLETVNQFSVLMEEDTADQIQ